MILEHHDMIYPEKHGTSSVFLLDTISIHKIRGSITNKIYCTLQENAKESLLFLTHITADKSVPWYFISQPYLRQKMTNEHTSRLEQSRLAAGHFFPDQSSVGNAITKVGGLPAADKVISST